MTLLLRQVGGVVSEFLQKNLCISERVREGLCSDILEAASHQSYVETFGSRADSWHRALKFTSVDEWKEVFSASIAKRLPAGIHGKIWVAIDITEEPFYGEPTLETMPWTGEQGIKAWWKFMTISLISSSFKKTIPLGCMPFRLGSNLAYCVDRMLDAAAAVLPRIDLVLMDRQFPSGEVIETLNRRGIHYLILKAKDDFVKCLAAQCHCTGQSAIIEHTLVWKSDKTTHHTPVRYVIFPDDRYDWTWATNLMPGNLQKLIRTYKCRWRIETMFRVQDEVRIKSKSIYGIVRYVNFLLSLLIIAVWQMNRTRVPLVRWLADIIKNFWRAITLRGIIPDPL